MSFAVLLIRVSVTAALASALAAPLYGMVAHAAEPRANEARSAALPLDLVSEGEIHDAGPTPPPDVGPETVIEGDDLQQPRPEDVEPQNAVEPGETGAGAGASDFPAAGDRLGSGSGPEAGGRGRASVERVPLARTGYSIFPLVLIAGVSLLSGLCVLAVRRS